MDDLKGASPQAHEKPTGGATIMGKKLLMGVVLIMLIIWRSGEKQVMVDHGARFLLIVGVYSNNSPR